MKPRLQGLRVALGHWWRGTLAWWRRPRPQRGELAGPPLAPRGAPLNLALPVPRCASVIIPALNEAERIADVVRYALDDPATAEVIVIDDSSIDDTAALARAAGATVHTSSMLGKGASMQDGLQYARQDLIAYLDGDLAGLQPGIITDLCRPLQQGQADFVKARFGRGGGRVTELTAKPMLKVFFPELAHLGQPLGGVIAARRSLLQTLTFETGYGVDIGLVIDAQRAGARLVEVDIGRLEHDSQPLHDLAAMAIEISHVIHARARAAGRLNVDQIARIYDAQRQTAADIDQVLAQRRGRQRVLLLGMDGTVSPVHYVHALAAATGQQAALDELLAAGPDSTERRARVAALFRFVHRRQFEAVAQGLPIRPGVVAWVNRMRRAGFMVGVVGDSYFVAADIVRRRVFADFALAHLLQFDAEVCTGELRTNPAFLPVTTDSGSRRAKATEGVQGAQFVVQKMRDDSSAPRVDAVWAVGHADIDAAMLRPADRAFVIDGGLQTLPGAVVFADFDALLAWVPAVAAETVSECVRT